MDRMTSAAAGGNRAGLAVQAMQSWEVREILWRSADGWDEI